VVAAPFAHAQKRIALLIGNQDYSAKVGALKNPHNDVLLVGAALRSLNFSVTEVKDGNYRTMDTAIKRHIQTVRREGRGTISFVYYSGHGAADPDTKINYLIPVDVANADDDDLWISSLNLNAVVEALQAQAPLATHYVVFDACRNELNLASKDKRALTNRGFVPMSYTKGVMIAYATAPGRTATDLGSGGAPYAKALADEIVKPGIEALTMFRRVALRVHQEIGQDPWLAASTLPEVYFAGEAAAVQPPPPPPQARSGEAAEAWAVAERRDSMSAMEAFIQRFGDTYYGDLARGRLAELRRVELAKKKTEDEARAKADSERQQVALLQQDAEKKRAEALAAKQKQDEDARAKAEAERQPVTLTAHIQEAQERLYELNYDSGPASGALTRQTEQAIREFEAQLGVPATGRLTVALLQRLRTAGRLSPWGAIVFSDTTQKWGMSWSHDTRKAAVAAAQASCGPDPSSCSKALTFFGAGCGAFAHSASRWSLIARDTSARARLAALEECQKQGARCSIVGTVCAGGQYRAQ
jgi:uncharacterized caspase-like protein